LPSRKLIEVALPLEAINKAAARENAMRVGGEGPVGHRDGPRRAGLRGRRCRLGREPDFGVPRVRYELKPRELFSWGGE
jgi:hypothetical protein